jgi:hypothetical protein
MSKWYLSRWLDSPYRRKGALPDWQSSSLHIVRCRHFAEPTDVDERDGGADAAKLVAGSSFSCFIEAGWGMIPTGINEDNTLQYTATECALNTYGVATKTFGLQGTPCKVSRSVILPGVTQQA